MESVNSSSMVHQRMQTGMLFGKLQKRYWLFVSDNNYQEHRAFDVRAPSNSKKKRTNIRIAKAGIHVQPGLYVYIGDPRQQQSPSNSSNATIVLPASAPTLGNWGDANLGGLSETPVLASSTSIGVSAIAGGVGGLPTVVSDHSVALPPSESTIPSS